MADLVWGVDVSCQRIAFATSTGRSGTIAWPAKLRDGARLFAARTAMWEFAREFATDSPPLYVWIEQPAGKPRPHPSLIEMVGVTKEAVYGVLSSLYPFPVTVAEVPVASWKKAALGNGHADKAAVMDWALTVGKPANQDEADALGVAYGGLKLMGSQGAAAA
jgi:hypothetical protein